MLLVLALCASVALAQYDGHTLIQLKPQTSEQSLFLRELMLKDIELDFWGEPNRLNKPVDVLVPPHKMELVRSKTSAMNIPFEIRPENVQEMVEAERAKTVRGARNVDLNGWNDFDTINDWTEGLPGSCPSGVSCQSYSIGDSYEGRPLTVFRMSTGANRAIWLDSAIHAREWLAPATLINVMDRCVSGYGSDSDVTNLLDNFDLYFLPVMNPDGYQYTFTNERLWRKNRRPQSSCVGVDLNRNYDHMHGAEGVSTNPCSDLFCGVSGGSEPETAAVQTEGERVAGITDLRAWLTIHTYGYMWMHPWGNTVGNNGFTCERATDHDEMYAIADETADAIEDENNTRWARGTSCEVIYETTGATDDYMKAAHGVKFPVCPELRGNGFIVDSSNIEPSYREFMAGLITMANLI